jgi:uncharacterized membrane protein YcjF (UPF0283 family)
MSSNRRQSIRELEESIKWYQKRWSTVVLWIVPISFVVILAISIIYQSNQLNAINAWISLILGFIATLLSIISTLLSFYNLEKTNELNDENRELMRKVEQKLTELPDKTAKAVKASFSNPIRNVEVRNKDFDFDEFEF